MTDARRRIENQWFWVSQGYDSLGRVSMLKSPNSVTASSSSSAGPDSERLRIQRSYNGVGALTSISDAAAGTVYWTAVSTSASGALLRQDLGNGLSAIHAVDRVSGLVKAITTGIGIGTTVQHLELDCCANHLMRVAAMP